MACPCYFLLHLVLCIQIPLGWEIETFPGSLEAVLSLSVTQFKWLK